MGCLHSKDQTNSNGKLNKPHIFFLLGGPGSGKGTQSDKLVEEYRFKHLSTGDLLREEISKGGEMAETIQKYMTEGKMLSSELVVKLLKKGIATYGNRRYLFDGFPRNQQNLDEYDRQLKDIVVTRNLLFFDCPNQVLTERIMKRAETSGRADDNKETLNKRLEVYINSTLPVVKEFEKRGNCIRIKADQPVEDVYKEVKNKLSQVNVFPPTKAKIIFVLGGPGSGKGTQCAILVKKYGFIHLSTGDLLREAVKNGSPLGKEIESCLKEGKLVSSELLVGLIQQQIQRNNYGGHYLLDGFPRGQQNIDVWEKQIAKRIDLQAILSFECPQEVLISRLLNRGKTSGRSDDTEQCIAKRLKVFNQQTKPALSYYKDSGIIHSFNTNQTVDEVTKELEGFIDTLGIFPKHPHKNKINFLCILGNPGSGKGTQCAKIAKKYGFNHICTGDLLRQEVNREGAHAELIAESMRLGKLVPSNIIVKLMREEINKAGWEGTFLLDGFPRNKQNIRRWNEDIGIQAQLKTFILLQCQQQAMKQRLMKRNKTGGRNDDSPESISKRFETYKNQTLPMVANLVDEQGIKLYKISACKDIEGVFTEIEELMLKQAIIK